VLVVDSVRGLQVFSYEGRLVARPKLGSVRPQLLRAGSVALSDDVLAIVDRTKKSRTLPAERAYHPRASANGSVRTQRSSCWT
jgi:hypothetical protein